MSRILKNHKFTAFFSKINQNFCKLYPRDAFSYVINKLSIDNYHKDHKIILL